MDTTLLLSGLGFAAGWAGKQLYETLTRSQAPPPGTDSLLNYLRFVPGGTEQGLIELKDGAMLATYRMGGMHTADATPAELEGVTHDLNRWLKGYGNNWCFYPTSRRFPSTGYPPADGSRFSAPVHAYIDELRRRSFQESQAGEASHYESERYFSVVHRPAGDPGSTEAAAEFRKKLAELEDAIGDMLGLRILGAGEHLSFLYDCVNFERRPVHASVAAPYIDTALACNDLVAGFKPKMGRTHFQAISITGFPPYTYNGVLGGLDHINCPMRWTSRIATMDTRTQRKLIRKKRDQHGFGGQDLSRRFSGSVIKKEAHTSLDQKFEEAYTEASAYTTIADATGALSAISEGETSFALFTSTILLFNKDRNRLEQAVRKVTKILTLQEFTYTVEYFNNVDAWRGSLPGTARNLRQYLLSGCNIADILSTSAVWSGLKHNPSPYFPEQSPPAFIARTRGREPYRFHIPSAGDVGHTMIIGDTGAGKSVLANFMISQFNRFRGSQTFVFDHGYSGQLLCEAAGGAHYNIGSDGGQGIGFQPLRKLALDNSQEMDWGKKFVELLFSVQGAGLTAKDKTEKIVPALRSLAQMPADERTLSSFFVLLQDQRLKQVIKVYTTSGSYGLLDQTEPAQQANAHQVFELSLVQKRSDEIYIPTLMYLMHRVDQTVDPARPTLVFVEEAWQAFNNPIFADYIAEKLLTWRKYNAHMILVVHKPAQLTRMERASILIDSCPQKIYLPNKNAARPQNHAAYRQFGLNETDITTISQMQSKREYYIKSPAGTPPPINLGLDAGQLAFVTDPAGYNKQTRQQAVKALKAAHEDCWPQYWLQKLGLPRQAELYDRIHEAFTGAAIPSHQPDQEARA